MQSDGLCHWANTFKATRQVPNELNVAATHGQLQGHWRYGTVQKLDEEAQATGGTCGGAKPA
jgi:hypothetical protein